MAYGPPRSPLNPIDSSLPGESPTPPSATPVWIDACFAGRRPSPPRGLDEGVNLEWPTQPRKKTAPSARQYNGWIYGVTYLEVPEGHRLYALGDRAFNFGLRWIAQPGDVYGRGNRLVLPGWSGADRLARGPHLRAPRQAQGAKALSTPHEIHLNLSDRTWAHWLIGDAGARWLGVPLLNLLEAPLQGLSLKVLENDYS